MGTSTAAPEDIRRRRRGDEIASPDDSGDGRRPITSPETPQGQSHIRYGRVVFGGGSRIVQRAEARFEPLDLVPPTPESIRRVESNSMGTASLLRMRFPACATSRALRGGPFCLSCPDGEVRVGGEAEWDRRCRRPKGGFSPARRC